MAAGPYSFIDIAVLQEVRGRFAAGDTLAILNVDLDEVIWANGPGAALLGYDDVQAVMGGTPGLGPVARRQISSTPGFPRMGRDKSIMVRLANGLTSPVVQFLASGITLPDGEPAVLLAVPANAPGSTEAGGIAARIIDGFSEAGYFAALVDAEGGISAASAGFEALGIGNDTLRRLAGEVARERSRLVKRLVRAENGSIPAGMARLTDDPPLHLLVAVNEAGDETAAPHDAGADELPEPSDSDLVERIDEDRRTARAEGSSRPSERDARSAGDSDDWYFTERSADKRAEAVRNEPVSPAAAGDRPEAPSLRQEVKPKVVVRPTPGSGPVRFVWRTDADGAFSAISDEFATAVGLAPDQIVGRRFREVAAAYDLDPTGEIAALLERRDTWSGRTVQWPITGTDLLVPVDLAALPVYGRDRAFEGFRGFGVARLGDAITDPGTERAPLADVDSAQAEPVAPPPMDELAEPSADEPAPSEPAGSDPFNGEVPVISIADRQERRSSDKVVRLAEHRPAAQAESRLSAGELNALQEIRERLRRDYEQRPEESEAEADQPESEARSEPPIEAVAEQDNSTIAKDDTPAATEDREFKPDNEPSEPAAQGGSASEDKVADEAYDEPHLRKLDAADEPGDAEDRDGVRQEADAAAPADDVAASDEAGEEGPDRDDAGDAETGSDASIPQPEGMTETVAEAGHEEEEQSVTHAVVERTPPLADAGFVPSAFAGEEGRTSIDAELISGLPLPLLVHAGDELYFANREFLELTGYASLDQIRREGGLDRLFVDKGPDDATTSPEGSKLRLRTLGGDEFPVDAHLQSIRWRGGSALLLSLRRIEPTQPRPAAPQVVPQPAAEHGTMEQRVEEMRTIIDTATDGVVLIAHDGTIRNISRPAEALFGFDSAEVEGKPFASLFAIESQRAARDYLAGLAENGVASVLNDGREVIGREAEGRFIPLFMTIGRLPGDNGYCAVVRDITQWKRAEEELTQARAQAERASSQKTEFLARVSHEIRTPLNAIIGFSELMMDEKFGPIGSDRYRDYLRDINRSGNHVLDLVNDLLDISKIEAGEQEMNYEAVSLNDTLAESVAMMQPQANRDRVIIRSSLASRLPEIVADLRSIRQIALNLLSNAVRYTQAGGQVIVSTAYETSGDVVMRVRDTGIGMTLSEIDQALKPFKQINALKRGRHDGTGLGLPLTKAMVEANRARFSIASTPGEGTMVEITFPSTRVLAD